MLGIEHRVEQADVQPHPLEQILGLSDAAGRARRGDLAVDVEQVAIGIGDDRRAVAHPGVGAAEKGEIGVGRGDERGRALRLQIIGDHARLSELAMRGQGIGIGHEMHLARGIDHAAEREQPAHQRPVGMDGTALIAQEDAAPVLLLAQGAVDSEIVARLGSGDAAIARQPRDLIRIDLDALVDAATVAARAAVTEPRAGRHRGRRLVVGRHIRLLSIA